MKKLYQLLVSILIIFSACHDEEVSIIRNSSPAETPEDKPVNGNENLSFLALGDSYTIGENVFPEQKWPEQLVDSLDRRNVLIDNLNIIARTGWRTDDLISAIESENPEDDYDMVSLLIGVNNQYQKRPIQQYREEFTQLLLKAIELTRHDDPKRVFVLSIPDYGYTPFASHDQKSISNEIDEYNAVNLQISSAYKVTYFNITDISRQNEPALVAADQLHPSAYQYSLWVKKIMENKNFVSFLQGLK